MIPQLITYSLTSRPSDRAKLILAGSLLLVGAAGCSGARTQTTAANPQAETRISRAPRESARPDADPGVAEEYPDFRGRRQAGQRFGGPALPSSSGSSATGEEISEPPPFPGVDQQNDGGPAASRSPRGVPRQMLAGGLHRSGSRAQTLPVSERHVAGAAASPAVAATHPAASPGREVSMETPYAPLDEPRRTIMKPPAWSLRYQAAHDEETAHEPQSLASTAVPDESGAVHGSEPVRMADPPRLNAPPSTGEAELLSSPSDDGLEIAKILVCRQVRGFDDVVEFNAQNLRQGQPILVYAALEKFLSIATGEGYRTQTLSVLEIQTLGGDVLVRMPLGAAVDHAETPRQEYFLTHRVRVPDNLPAGHYIFDLRVDDVQSRESARAHIQVTVTEDRNRRDETAGTSKFATRPASFLR